MKRENVNPEETKRGQAHIPRVGAAETARTIAIDTNIEIGRQKNGRVVETTPDGTDRMTVGMAVNRTATAKHTNADPMIVVGVASNVGEMIGLEVGTHTARVNRGMGSSNSK